MGLSGRYSAEPSPLDEEQLQIELSQKDITPHDYAKTLAERKAHAKGVTMSHNGDITLIIGSDTIVDLEGHISKLAIIVSDCVHLMHSF